LGRRTQTTPKRGSTPTRYSSPARQELKFGSGRISLTAPSPKFLRSPSSFTIKLGGASNSPVQFNDSVKRVNTMLRTPVSQRRRAATTNSPDGTGSDISEDGMLCCWSFLSLSLSLSLSHTHTHIHTYIHTGTKLLIPVSIRKPCNCKKSKCLKLYCECFAARMYCVGCNCADCNNNSKHDEIRNDAIKAVLERNPKAFDAKIQGKKGAKAKKHSKGYVLSLSLSLFPTQLT